MALDYFQMMSAMSVLAATFILAASIAIIAQGTEAALPHAAHTALASAAPRAKGITAHVEAEGGCFFAAQLADPQLGVVNGGSADASTALDWSAELALLDTAVRELNRLGPRFVVLSGDIQNWDPSVASHGALDAHGDVGARQAESARRSLARLRVPLRAVTPGNHDIGDSPDADTISAYERRWGADRAAFVVDGVQFLSFNSLLLRDASRPGMRARRDAQQRWLVEQLQSAHAQNVTAAVLLTHVPPFVGEAAEAEGWANWPIAERERFGAEVLARSALRPSVLVAGHFHGNVLASGKLGGAPLRVVTTSSVSCPVSWNGHPDSWFTPAQASRIAAAPSGTRAFADFVLRTDGRGEADPRLVPARVTPTADAAGVRLFEFCPGRGMYRHAWLTLRELSATEALVEGVTLGAPASGFEPLRASSG